MKSKISWMILPLMMPVLLLAQAANSADANREQKGIRFEHAISWRQVQEKARRENKYIFLDCYTTWCGPCREMEKKVYSLENVGDSVNDEFISVKVQMDTSVNDNDFVKSWYHDAHIISDKYKLEGYPSYLFFNPEGRIINRGMGLQSPENFVKITAFTKDPSKDYYKLMRQFQGGKRDLNEMSFMAGMGLLLGDTANADIVAREYVSHIQNVSMLTKDNIVFINQYTRSSADKGFQWIYDHAAAVDSIMENDIYAEQFVQGIIYKEIIIPAFEKAKKTPGSVPDWEGLKAGIRKKYNEYYAGRVITASRSTWGSKHKDMVEYTKYLVLYVDLYGTRTSAFSLNNYAWAIFVNSNNPEELEHALVWSGRAVLIEPFANWMDTYANILYKLGRVKEAMQWEDVSVRLEPADDNFRKNYEKMKKGEPTGTTRSEVAL